MIIDNLRHRCTIYRLKGIEEYDESSSEEGEVTEEWGIVEEDVYCLFEPEDTSFQRRVDGIVDIGTHRLFLKKGTDIKNADRIYWANSEFGEAFYSVRAVMPKRDRFLRPHHIEALLDHIDWTPPTITAEWEPS